MINDWVIIYCGKALGHLTSFRYEVQERAEMQLCHAIGTYTTGDNIDFDKASSYSTDLR